jgi:hypothetical protein
MVSPPQAATPPVLAAAVASLCVFPLSFLHTAASKVSFPSLQPCLLRIKLLLPALFPIYSDLRGVPDLSHADRNVAAVPSAMDPAPHKGSGHIQLSEDAELNESIRMDADAAVVSPAHDGDALAIDASHDESSVESSLTTKSQNVGIAQDSYQNLQDMKLIVRVTMVGLVPLTFQSAFASFILPSMLIVIQVLTSLSYIFCAALGYMSFPTTADGNILKTYPASPANDVLVLSMAASIILSYPGELHPQTTII